jgi:hypothetical protein
MVPISREPARVFVGGATLGQIAQGCVGGLRPSKNFPHVERISSAERPNPCGGWSSTRASDGTARSKGQRKMRARRALIAVPLSLSLQRFSSPRSPTRCQRRPR